MNARYTQIDIAKGIGILFVVLGHNPIVLYPKGELFNIIFSFHLPLFFFLSGIFMPYHSDLPGITIKKFDSYLKPYFSILCLMSIFIIASERVTPARYFAGILYGTGESIPPDWSALWFLPHLWAVSLFSYLCYTHLKLGAKSPLCKMVFLISTLSAGFVGLHFFWNIPLSGTHGLPLGLPFSLDVVLVSSFYFLLGGFLKQYTLNLNFEWPSFIMAAFVFGFLHLHYHGTIDFNLRRYDHLVRSTIEALLGIYLIISLSTLLQKRPVVSRVLSYIGSATLFILIFHLFIQKRSFNLLNSWSGNHSVANAFLSFIFAILAPLLLQNFVKRNNLLEAVFLPVKASSDKERISLARKRLFQNN